MKILRKCKVSAELGVIFSRNYVETVHFGKISTPGILVKICYFMHCMLVTFCHCSHCLSCKGIRGITKSCLGLGENFNRSSRPEVFCKKGVLEISQHSQENACARASFFEISKNTFLHRTPLVAASVSIFLAFEAHVEIVICKPFQLISRTVFP